MHRHGYQGRKLSRKSGPRQALIRGLATSVLLYEKVKTTLPKAKEVQPVVEKLITVAKKGDLAAVRKLSSYVYGENAVQKLLTEIAPIYKDRQGGYTRIIKTGFRAGDAAQMAIIELVDIEKLDKKATVKKVEKPVEKDIEEKVASKKTPATTRKSSGTTKKTTTKKAAK